MIAKFLILSSLTLSNGFVPSVFLPAAPLHMGNLRSATSFDDMAYSTFQRAENCLDGSCSIEQAEQLLNEVLSIQAHCVAADAELTAETVCKDAILTSELIVGLRTRINSASEAIADESNFWLNRANNQFVELAGFSFDDSTGRLNSQKALMSPFGLEYMVSFLFILTVVNAQLSGISSDTLVPFTLEEWGWAARHGYFLDMFTHGHGGIGMAGGEGDALTPFILGEWGWAIRDGYFSDMFKHGGAGF
mmetsp:Transcript_14211/g.29183  ORF Transcript_14211/g.29183 Transcript_14211/m.29183 type:complete len:248 (+) Transcript_14211:49-792(+)